MKIFCFFVEPSSYTIDLATNVYEKKGIDYCFIKSISYAESSSFTDKYILQKKSILSRCIFIYKIFKSYDYIIINGYNNLPFLLTFFLNIISINKKYIAIDSDTQLNIPRNFIKRYVKQLYLNIVFRNKKVLGYAGGSKNHKDLFRYYGMSDDRIFLIPMMVNNAKFYCDKKFPKIFTFLYVGRLVKHKGVENLIKKFNLVFSKNNAILRIVGSGNQEDYLKSKYQSDRIIFAGKKVGKDLISEYHNASCFVLPSLFEPWGLVVNEALSSSLPVISFSNVGASYDLISNKNTGLLAQNIDDFADKMMLMFSKKSMLLEFSRNATFFMKNKWNYSFYNYCLEQSLNSVKS